MPDSNLPYLTTDLPGIGGVLKQVPDDFVVEEIPAYEPVGEGEHLFLWIEKRDTSAEQLTRHLAQALGIARQEVGTAGLKDRRAVTRQYVSVPAACENRLDRIDSENIRVLHVKRHRNKLRSGHLQGNRFSILVRNAHPEALRRAEAIAALLSKQGFPNYFGEQRFGQEGETLTLGLQLLRREKTPKDIPYARRKFLLRLALSAVQSHLFNVALAERLNDGLLHRVLPGDVMQVVASGGPFVVEDAAVEQQRFDAGETAITGPMFGPKMKSPTGEPAQREEHVLHQSGLTAESFQQFARLTPGTRRPYLIHPGELALAEDTQGLRFQFTLPSGVYATVVLREFMKLDD